MPAVCSQHVPMRQVRGIVCQGEQVHFVARSKRSQLVKGTDLFPLVRRVRDPVAQKKDLHTAAQMDGIQRMILGPITLVHDSGIRFHAATGSWNFASTGLMCGTSRALTR